MAKTFFDKWTDRTTVGAIVEELFQRECGGFVGVYRIDNCRTSGIFDSNGHGWSTMSGNLVPLPTAPVVRPWASRADMFAVCGPTPVFRKKSGGAWKTIVQFSDINDTVLMSGGHWASLSELADSWLWYDDYGSDDGKPCVMEVKP